MMKQHTTLAVLLLALVCQVKATDISTLNYIERFKDLAKQESLRSRIPASIILSQAIHESGSGTSKLSLNTNNHFGIKCKSDWQGETYKHEDDDRNQSGELIASCFRSYNSTEESYVDHSNFLMYRPYYKELFQYATNDYVSWAIGLQKCGYATDPGYALKIIDIIEKNNLQQFDMIDYSPFKKEVTTIPQPQITSTVKLDNPEEAISLPQSVKLHSDYKRGQYDTYRNKGVKEIYTRKEENTHTRDYTPKTKEPEPSATSSKYSNTMRTIYEKRLIPFTYVPKASNARR